MKWKKKALELEAKVKSSESIISKKESLREDARREACMYSAAWKVMKRILKTSEQNASYIPYKQWMLEIESVCYNDSMTHSEYNFLSALMNDICDMCEVLGYTYEDLNGCLLKTTGCNKNLFYFQNTLSWSEFSGNLTPEDTLIVSSYRPDGRYSTKYIKAEIKQIVDVIYEDDYDKLFCSSDDYAVFCTEGKRLHSCVAGLDEQFITELTKALPVPEETVMGKTGSGMSFRDKCLLCMDEKIIKLEELKKSRCAKCSGVGNSEDMWCWNLPWCHCDVKSLREELEGKCENPLSAKEYVDALLEKHGLNMSRNSSEPVYPFAFDSINATEEEMLSARTGAVKGEDRPYFKKTLNLLLERFPIGGGPRELEPFIENTLPEVLGEAGTRDVEDYYIWGEVSARRYIRERLVDMLNERDRRRFNMNVHDVMGFLQRHAGKTIDIKSYSVQVYDDGKQAAVSYNGDAILKIEQRGNEENMLHFFMPEPTDKTIINYKNDACLEAEAYLGSLHKHFSEHACAADAILALNYMIEYDQA